jgi:hypothetical protein
MEVAIRQSRFQNLTASGMAFRYGNALIVIVSSPCKTTDGRSETISVPASKSGLSKVGAIAALRGWFRAASPGENPGLASALERD